MPEIIYVVENATDPSLNGPVKMHIPTLYERITIGTRKAELCAPVKWDDMPSAERGITEALATLEFVIDTAPEGFYDDIGGEKILNIGSLLQTNEMVFWGVYGRYMTEFNRFRGAAVRPLETSKPEQPAGDVASSQTAESGPPASTGDSGQ